MPSAHAELYVHLVWATRDREPTISESIRGELWPALAAKCSDLECTCLAVGGVEDHVHVLARYPPGLAVAKLVAQLKGSTSHLINHSQITPAGFYWQGSYGAFSISRRSVPNVVEYVRGQVDHHTKGDLMESLEQIGVE